MNNQEMQFADPDWRPSQGLNAKIDAQEQERYIAESINDEVREHQQPKMVISPLLYQEGYNESGTQFVQQQMPETQFRPRGNRRQGPWFWIILALIIVGIISGAFGLAFNRFGGSGGSGRQTPDDTRHEAGHVLDIKSNTQILDAQGHPISPRCKGPHNDTGAIVPAGWSVVVLRDIPVAQPGIKENVYVAYPDPCQPGDDFSHNENIADGSGAVGYIAFSDLAEVHIVTPHSAFSNRGTAWRDCWDPTNCTDATYLVENGPLMSSDGSVLYAWWTGSYWDPHWWHVKDPQGHQAAIYGRDWTTK